LPLLLLLRLPSAPLSPRQHWMTRGWLPLSRGTMIAFSAVSAAAACATLAK
jgi:hypothetical protein